MRFSHSKLLSISWLLQILLIPHPPHFLFRADFCIFTHENSISLIHLVHIFSHKQCAVIKNTIFFLLKVEKNKRKSYDFITSKLNEELEGERKEKEWKMG